MLERIGLSPMFYVMGAVSIAGAALTIFMVPDSRTLDLAEEDQKFMCAWVGEDRAKAMLFKQCCSKDTDGVDHPAMATDIEMLSQARARDEKSI